MGNNANISKTHFPKQSDSVGSRVKVCFHYDTKNTVEGTIVRDDREDPFRTIIRLDDGRFVLATECQYTFDESAPRVLLDVTELVSAIEKYLTMSLTHTKGSRGPLNAVAYIGERLVAIYQKHQNEKGAKG